MKYTDIIAQTADQLLQLEKQQTNARLRDYVRLLRLLKTQLATTQQQAATQLNLSLRQVQRLWKRYQLDGIDCLIESRYQPYWGKLSSAQISQLRAYLFTDQAQTLGQIQTFVLDSFGVSYTIAGLSELCHRLQIKPKKGRPVNVRQEPGAIEAFKKSLPT